MRHLRHFIAVAEEMHFGRAAERLFMAQPPLSQSIRQLEMEIGCALFERTSRRVALTPAGEVFLVDARQILALTEAAAISARRAAKGEAGWLGIGFSASASYDLLPDVLRAFRDTYPAVELLLYEQNAAEQADALRGRTIHLGIARPSIDEPGVVREIIAREPFIAAIPEGHPLAALTEITLSSLATESLILFPRLPKPSYGDTVLALCESAGFTPRAAQEVREMQTAISLVAAGIGIALVPEPVQNLRRAGVAYRPLSEPSARTELTAAYRADDISPVLRNFITVLRRQIPL